jgi:hypothetical protein
MRSLSAILSRSAGHDALLELLEFDDDVTGLKSWLVKIGSRAADDEPIDETARDDLVRMVGRAVVITNKLDAAYGALGPSR